MKKNKKQMKNKIIEIFLSWLNGRYFWFPHKGNIVINKALSANVFDLPKRNNDDKIQ